ncbi:hypothetical protein OsI_20109 [Oryza sativa Indica Group]|uniref:Uncharacterized protein n=2 Tax=Oryza TaxID=4527 RepID=A2Y536_ORYSI|nr:hypothetical protein OsI_20109 [Oryza sativa Indica Group]
MRLSTGRQPLLAPGRRQLLLRLPRRDGDSRSARIRRSRPSPSRACKRKQNKMERSSSKPVIALVLLVVCIVSCFEVVTAQYDGSSSNGAAATGPMAAGGNCSLVVAAAVLAIPAFVGN